MPHKLKASVHYPRFSKTIYRNNAVMKSVGGIFCIGWYCPALLISLFLCFWLVSYYQECPLLFSFSTKKRNMNVLTVFLWEDFNKIKASHVAE